MIIPATFFSEDAAPPPPTGNPFILTQTLGALRADFSGCVGMRIQVQGSDIEVVSLGRWKVAGNSNSHTVYLLDSAGNTLRSVSVNIPAGSAGGYVYADITPITLTGAFGVYYLVSNETSGGDQWYSDDTVPTSTSGVGSTVIEGSCYSSTCGGGAIPTISTVNNAFVPVNFKTQ